MFFIVSPYPKSGTTLVLNMINNHSINQGEKNHEDVLSAHIWNVFSDYIDQTSSNFFKFHYNRNGYKDKLIDFITGLSTNNFLKGQKYPYIKDPEVIRIFFPNSPIICVARDPRDSFASYKCMKINRQETPISAKEWSVSHGNNLLKYIKLSNKHYFLLSYENLVHNFKTTTFALYNFLNLKEEYLDTSYANKTLNQMTEQIGKVHYNEDVSLSRIGRYKNELTKDEISDLSEVIKLYIEYKKNTL